MVEGFFFDRFGLKLSSDLLPTILRLSSDHVVSTKKGTFGVKVHLKTVWIKLNNHLHIGRIAGDVGCGIEEMASCFLM